MCRNGRYTERGIKERNGYGSDFFRIEPEFLIKLDPSLGMHGVLVEPTSVVAKAWDHTERIGRRSRAWEPKTLLVTGAGPIGLLAAMMGAQRGLDVHVLDHHESLEKHRHRATKLGGKLYLGRISRSRRPQAGYPDGMHRRAERRAATHSAARRRAASSVWSASRRRATISTSISAKLNRTMVLDNDTVFGTVNANRKHYEDAVAALQRADKDWLARLITRRVPVEQWTQALDARAGRHQSRRRFHLTAHTWLRPSRTTPLIGDCESAALVSRDGSIDWLCWPRFDSEACFAALLGTPDNGRWLIAPREEGARITRRYRPDTLILETHFETPDGAATLVDFMPLRHARNPRSCASFTARAASLRCIPS